MRSLIILSSFILLWHLQAFPQDTVYIRPVHPAIHEATVFTGSSLKFCDVNILNSNGKSGVNFDVRMVPRLGIFLADHAALGVEMLPSSYNDRTGNKTTMYLYGVFGRYYIEDQSPNMFVEFEYMFRNKDYDFTHDTIGYTIVTIEKQKSYGMGLGYTYFGDHITLEASLNIIFTDKESIDWDKILNNHIMVLNGSQTISFQPRIGVHFYF
ncbi:MAG: hypothetical protein NTW49_07350 [Bacteroidia bacterium]|nr:hypothetical protein [Bacteroidia bacterium]